MNAGTTAAILAASRQRQLQIEEEEQLTPYSPQDLAEDWEFKIMRNNNLGGFESAGRMQRLLVEEAQAGWEIVEKIDANRVRFKRSRGARERDATLPAGYDPYRTTTAERGISAAGIALVAGIAVALLAIVFIVILAA